MSARLGLVGLMVILTFWFSMAIKAKYKLHKFN